LALSSSKQENGVRFEQDDDDARTSHRLYQAAANAQTAINVGEQKTALGRSRCDPEKESDPTGEQHIGRYRRCYSDARRERQVSS
jgi:hypothetical protein